MTVENFLDQKEVVINGKKFLISRIPTLKAHELYGRIVQSVGNYGKLGMTMLPSEIAKELLEYCAAEMPNGGWTVLDTNDTINTYLPRLEDFIRLQYEMYQENFGFFTDGKLTAILGLKEE